MHHTFSYAQKPNRECSQPPPLKFSLNPASQEHIYLLPISYFKHLVVTCNRCSFICIAKMLEGQSQSNMGNWGLWRVKDLPDTINKASFMQCLKGRLSKEICHLCKEKMSKRCQTLPVRALSLPWPVTSHCSLDSEASGHLQFWILFQEIHRLSKGCWTCYNFIISKWVWKLGAFTSKKLQCNWWW